MSKAWASARMPKLGSAKVYQCVRVYNRGYYALIVSQMNLYQKVFHSGNYSPEDCCQRTLAKAKTFPALQFRTVVPF